MELLNESPPTGGVLNTVSSSPSTASSAAVFSSQGALSASSSSSTSADINNLNSGLSSASFCLALGTSNFVNSLPSSGNENLLDNQRFLNETHLNDKLSSVRNQSDFATLPISTSINSIKSSSSSTSSSSSCASLNSNFSSPSSTFSLCAQNLFSSANSIQHQHSVKVKRTRQRVDAGEPRNSYASIANYASNRLGKTTKNFQTPLLPPPNKGLLDQLSPYLGLNALLSSNTSYSPEDFANSLNNQPNNSINTLLASLATDKNINSPPLFTKTAIEDCNSKTNKLSNSQQMLLLDHQKHQKNSSSPLNWDTITNRNLNNPNNLQCELLNSSYAGLVTANLIEPIIDKNMAKSRFSEDALTLEYNAKVSKHSDFIETNQIELPTDSSPMTPNDLLLSVKSVSNIMENNEEESLAQDQTKQNDENVNQTTVNDENDKNTENNSHKSPDSECEDSENRKRSHMSASNSNSSHNSSRSSSPDLEEDSQVIRANESKRFRVDNIVNNLAAERINSNSSCNSNSSSLTAAKFSNSVNGCKNRRKLNQPQQCKVSNENDLDELEEEINQQSIDEEEEDEEEDYNSTGQQMNLSLRKSSLAHEDIDKIKSQFESFLRLCEQQQLQQQQHNFNVNSNSNNLRSTRVSDRGRLNGTLHSNNNSATSTPVNLSINSPRPNDVDDEYLSSSRNQEFYDDKNDIDNVSINGLSNNLCKELCNLVDELQKAFCSKKLFLNLQDKMRVRLNLLLNCNNGDLDLEQFFLDIKELLSNSILQTIESNFNRFKMNILLKNFTYNGPFNNSNSFNNLSNNHTISNNLNQSSKNLNQASAVALHNKQQLRNKNDSQIENLRSNFVDQLSNRFNFNNRSSHQAGLLAGLENNSANTALSNKLFSQALNSNNSFSDFKTPSPFGILPDNSNLALMQHLSFLQAQQEQLQKENQQDSALSLIAPKRKRIKASDEPRRTRTSNRLPSNPLSNSMNSQQSKTTSEMIANLVSRELNSSTPKTNLHLPSNNIISGSSLSNTEQLNLDAHFNTNSTNNTSVNNSNNVFPFNNSFMNSLNTADQLEVQQIMLAAAAASHNNGLNLNNGNNSSNRASPLSSFGNLSSGQTPFNLLDPSPENSINNDCGLDGSEITTTLSPVHLRKAKLMFFYVRYPSSNILKTYFRDIKFNKNNTAQLVKWFSNFREFYYQQVDKYARQELSNGRKDVKEIHVPSDSELLKVLNVHYNRQNHISVPESFRVVVEQTVREFFRAIQAGKDDNEPSWRKPIYKVISRLDTTVPECFRQPNFLEALESNNFTEL